MIYGTTSFYIIYLKMFFSLAITYINLILYRNIKKIINSFIIAVKFMDIDKF